MLRLTCLLDKKPQRKHTQIRKVLLMPTAALLCVRIFKGTVHAKIIYPQTYLTQSREAII